MIQETNTHFPFNLDKELATIKEIPNIRIFPKALVVEVYTGQYDIHEGHN